MLNRDRRFWLGEYESVDDPEKVLRADEGSWMLGPDAAGATWSRSLRRNDKEV